MIEILDALDKLRAVSSRNEKKRILQESKSDLFANIFKWAYDPFITFGVHKIDISNITYKEEVNDNLWIMNLCQLLQKLQKRELTGNAAKDAVKELLSKSTKRHADLIMNILKKDLRIGAGIRVINSVYANLLPEDFCMAANKYDPKRVDFPVYADTKLDGVRCIAVIEDRITLYSRNGKEFKNYTTIEEELKIIGFPHGTRLDGEITMGHFQNLMRTLSRKDEGVELAKDAIYNIFDVQDSQREFAERMKQLENQEYAILRKKLEHLKVVNGKRIEAEEYLHTYYNEMLEAGHEGIMIKAYEGKYEYKRGWAWQKMKPELSEDLRILDVKEGTGKYVGQLGYVVCDLKNGNVVHVGSGFKDDERVKLWADKNQLLGRMIEIKYQEKTRDGSLRFPIFKCFRPDKE